MLEKRLLQRLTNQPASNTNSSVSEPKISNKEQNLNETQKTGSKLNQLANSIFKHDIADKQLGSIFDSNISDELKESYGTFIMSKTGSKEEQLKASEDFATKLIMEDMKDGQLDLSPLNKDKIFNKKETESTKQDKPEVNQTNENKATKPETGIPTPEKAENSKGNILLQAMKYIFMGMDMEDDNIINGSPVNDPNAIKMLDHLDNGQIDNSVDNYLYYLMHQPGVQEQNPNANIGAYSLLAPDFSLPKGLSDAPQEFLPQDKGALKQPEFNPNGIYMKTNGQFGQVSQDAVQFPPTPQQGQDGQVKAPKPTSEMGNKLAEWGKKYTDPNMDIGGYAHDGGHCYAAAARAIEQGSGVFLTGSSAFEAAPQLAESGKFKEITVDREELPNLPGGAVVVWNATDGHPHGHISISGGNGKEYSDVERDQMTNYGEKYRVFIPNDMNIA